MNVNKNIKNLLYALKQKEKFYKINSFKSYSEKNNILKKELIEIYNPKTETIEYEEKYNQDYECYSKINLMKYLAEEYRKGSEADGK